MRRFAVALTGATLTLAACSGRGPGAEPGPGLGRGIARPLEIYAQLGMLAGPEEFPAVARFATLAGAGDSTLLILSMSLPNSAMRFQRDEAGFMAEYRVTTAVLRDSQQVAQVERRETVRVGSFAETSRTEESIVFQDMLPLLPGNYVVQVQVADLNSTRGFRAIDTVEVPSYLQTRALATPLLVYEGTGRAEVSERPELLLNPRNTVAYGADAPLVYLERYGADGERPVALRVVDDQGALIWSAQTPLTGSDRLYYAVVEVPAAALPIGRLWLEASESDAGQPQRSPLLVTISEQWMVANFEEVLRFLSVIAHPSELDSLRAASGTERRERWERFWAIRDPLPATPINEFRDSFFERIRIANDEFAEFGRAGWESDRGEVFVVLGAPDEVVERQIGRDLSAQPNMLQWIYESLPGGRLILQFIDRSGFGRYELTQASRSAFRTMAVRMRPRR